MAEGDTSGAAPSDDVDGLRWARVSALRALPGLTRSCARFAEEALRRFGL
jgi:hypothetical protein